MPETDLIIKCGEGRRVPMKIKYDHILQVEYIGRDGSRRFANFHRSEKLSGNDLERFEKRYGHIESQNIVKVPIGREW